MEISGHTVEVSNLEKVLWPEEGYTKADLIQYYLDASEYILAYLEDRPAILQRFPNGLLDSGFYQQNVGKPPPYLKTKSLKNQAGRVLDYAIYTDSASLIYLVNLGTITQNPWHSRVSNLDKPDYVVFDLDPHAAPFSNVLEVALALRDILKDCGITGYPKTSGSTGIHVYVPIRRRYGYDETLEFAEQISSRVATSMPKLATVDRRIASRSRNQVYVDSQQNARGKSAASIYSVRAKPGATVSTPVTWDEVASGIRISDFTIKTVPKRLKKIGDLWRDFFKNRQSLPKPRGDF